jgi:hypothetical protein
MKWRNGAGFRQWARWGSNPRLIVEWSRPLHVVVVVDDVREDERIVTVYEPDKDRWSPDFKVRKQ